MIYGVNSVSSTDQKVVCAIFYCKSDGSILGNATKNIGFRSRNIHIYHFYLILYKIANIILYYRTSLEEYLAIRKQFI